MMKGRPYSSNARDILLAVEGALPLKYRCQSLAARLDSAQLDQDTEGLHGEKEQTLSNADSCTPNKRPFWEIVTDHGTLSLQ